MSCGGLYSKTVFHWFFELRFFAMMSSVQWWSPHRFDSMLNLHWIIIEINLEKGIVSVSNLLRGESPRALRPHENLSLNRVIGLGTLPCES